MIETNVNKIMHAQLHTFEHIEKATIPMESCKQTCIHQKPNEQLQIIGIIGAGVSLFKILI